MRILFLKWLLFWMRYDLAQTKNRMQFCRDIIAFDEKRIHEYEMELFHLEKARCDTTSTR